MADYEPPEDLIKAQRAYNEADAAVQKVTDALPSSLDIVAGEAEISEAQRAELDAARAKRLDLLDQVNQHQWWETVDDRFAAWKALHATAKS